MPRTKPVRPAGPVLVKAEVYETRTIKLNFQFGWAIFRIDEKFGSLSVESDWGTYSYAWGHGGRPGPEGVQRTLQDFLSTCSRGYIANKLLVERRQYVVDEHATRREMKKRARELFQEGLLSSILEVDYDKNQLFQELTSEIHEFCSGLDGLDIKYAYYEKVGEYLGKVFDPLHEHIESKRPSLHEFLSDELIPVFQAYLRGELDGPITDSPVG